MKFKPAVDKDHFAYGYLFEVDYTEEFDKFNIHANFDDYSIPSSKLDKGDLRKHLNIDTELKGTNFQKFKKRVITQYSVADMIEYDDRTQSQFDKLWPYNDYDFTNEDWLEKYTSVGGILTEDKKGYELGIHTDNNFVVANWIINVNDNTDSTKFYNQMEHHYYSAPCERGKGVFFFNTRYTLHSVKIIQEIRNALLFNLLLYNR